MANDENRGRPYYEKLRRDLKTTIERKRELDATLARHERNIATAENAYLEETAIAGNIVKGYDNYIKSSATAVGGASTSTGTGTATRRKGGISDEDRIFSRSSWSWVNQDASATNAGPNSSNNDNRNSSGTPSEVATPVNGASGSGRGTPTVGNKPGNKNNKKKAPPMKEEEDERPTKRGKISWGRE